jgi:hypothetical protein
VRLSSTPTPEDDEHYDDICHNYEAECHAHRRHMGEDLIWHTHMQREDYNLNHCARQLGVREAYLHRRERRCDRHEADIHAARMSGTDTGRESGSE